jgi:hypothetical protein
MKFIIILTIALLTEFTMASEVVKKRVECTDGDCKQIKEFKEIVKLPLEISQVSVGKCYVDSKKVPVFYQVELKRKDRINFITETQKEEDTFRRVKLSYRFGNERHEKKFKKEWGHLEEIPCSLTINLKNNAYLRTCLDQASKYAKKFYCK